MNRFNPFKLAENLIESNYQIPVSSELMGVGANESFMTSPDFKTVNLAEYLDFLRSCIYRLQGDVELYSQYHKIAHEIRDTGSRSEYQEGCRDTFGAGFFIEYDEYKEFREQYWKIQKIKEQRDGQD